MHLYINIKTRMESLPGQMFQEMKEKGPSAIAKYWNDPKYLKKISERIGLQANPQQSPPSQSIPVRSVQDNTISTTTVAIQAQLFAC